MGDSIDSLSETSETALARLRSTRWPGFSSARLGWSSGPQVHSPYVDHPCESSTPRPHPCSCRPDLYRAAAFQVELVHVPLNILLHAQRRIQRPWRVIFMGDQCAGEGQEDIAGRLDGVTFLVMRGVHHQFEGRIDEGARFFGVEVFDQLHRVLDVGKEGGVKHCERFPRLTR